MVHALVLGHHERLREPRELHGYIERDRNEILVAKDGFEEGEEDLQRQATVQIIPLPAMGEVRLPVVGQSVELVPVGVEPDAGGRGDEGAVEQHYHS